MQEPQDTGDSGPGGRVAEEPQDAGGDGSGDGGEGETADGGDDGRITTSYSGDCSVERADHTQSCDDDCPIVADFRVGCDHYGFGNPGLRVAPDAAEDRLFFVAAGSNYAWFGTLGPGATSAVKTLPAG